MHLPRDKKSQQAQINNKNLKEFTFIDQNKAYTDCEEKRQFNQPIVWNALFINNKFYLCDKNALKQLNQLQIQIQKQKQSINQKYLSNIISQQKQNLKISNFRIDQINNKNSNFGQQQQKHAKVKDFQISQISCHNSINYQSEFNKGSQLQKMTQLINALDQEQVKKKKKKQEQKLIRIKKSEQKMQFQMLMKRKSNVKQNVNEHQIRDALQKKLQDKNDTKIYGNGGKIMNIKYARVIHTKQPQASTQLKYSSNNKNNFKSIPVVQHKKEETQFLKKIEQQFLNKKQMTKIKNDQDQKDVFITTNSKNNHKQQQQKIDLSFQEHNNNSERINDKNKNIQIKKKDMFEIKIRNELNNSINNKIIINKSEQQQNQMIQTQNQQQTVPNHRNHYNCQIPTRQTELHRNSYLRQNQKGYKNFYLEETNKKQQENMCSQTSENQSPSNQQPSNQQPSNQQPSIKGNTNKFRLDQQELNRLYLQKKTMEQEINKLKKTLRQHQIENINKKINLKNANAQQLITQNQNKPFNHSYQAKNDNKFSYQENIQVGLQINDKQEHQDNFYKQNQDKKQFRNNEKLVQYDKFNEKRHNQQQKHNSQINRNGVGKIFKNARKSIDLISQVKRRNESRNNSCQKSQQPLILQSKQKKQKLIPRFSKQENNSNNNCSDQFKECHFNQDIDIASYQNQQTEYIFKKDTVLPEVSYQKNNNRNFQNTYILTAKSQKKDAKTIDIDSQIKYKKPLIQIKKKELQAFDNTAQSIPFNNGNSIQDQKAQQKINLKVQHPQFIRSAQFQKSYQNRSETLDTSKGVNRINIRNMKNLTSSLAPKINQNQLLFSKFIQMQKTTKMKNQFVYNQSISQQNNPEFMKSENLRRYRNIQSGDSYKRQGRSLNLRGIIIKNSTKNTLMNQRQRLSQDNQYSQNIQSSFNPTSRTFANSKVSKFYKSKKFQTIDTPSQANTNLGHVYRLKLQTVSPKNGKTLYELQFQKKGNNNHSESQEQQEQEIKIPKIQFTYKQIPQLPKPPHRGINQQEFMKITQKLCKVFNITFKREKISQMVMKKYKNCLIFNLPETNKKVIWHYEGKVYIGEGQQDGHKSGEGIQYISNKHFYKGQFLNNKKHGSGILINNSGDIYEGQWIQNEKNGTGKFYSKISNQYYEGEFKNGKPQGYGILKVNDKRLYQGTFLKSLRHGFGRQIFQNGDKYKGEYQKDKFNGKGKYKWSNGNFYSGSFVNGYRHGKGKWKSSTIEGDIYKGDYFQDKKQGQGKYIWSDGTIFQGNFNQDKKDGQGKVIYTDGKQIKGIWKMDKVEQILSQSYQKGGDKPLNPIQRRQIDKTTKIKLIEQENY